MQETRHSSTSGSIQEEMSAVLSSRQARSPRSTAERASTPWRVLRRDAVLLGIVILVLESMLQAWAPQYRRNLYDGEFTGSCPLDLNAEGYRGDAVPVAKEAKEVRVLALGDSVTFGAGVASNRTWPAQFGEMLSERSGRPVSVINAGMAGASLDELRFAYETLWSRHRPDVVAVAVSGNMVSLAWIRRDQTPAMPRNGYAAQPRYRSFIKRLQTRSRRLRYSLCLPSFLSQNAERAMYWLGLANHNIDPRAPYGAMLAYGWRQGGLEPSLADRAWDLLAADLAELRDVVVSHGAELVVTFTPCRFELSSSLWDNEKAVPRYRLAIDPSAQLRTVCASLDIPFAEALDAVRERRCQIREREHRSAPMYVSFHYNHLDVDGNRALADAFLSCLGANGLMKHPDGRRGTAPAHLAGVQP